MKEIRTKEWKKHDYLSIFIEKFRSWAKFKWLPWPFSKWAWFLHFVTSPSYSRATERINPAFTVRGKKVVFARVAYEKNFGLAWKLVIYIILETLSQERDHLPWYVIGCKMFFTFFPLSLFVFASNITLDNGINFIYAINFLTSRLGKLWTLYGVRKYTVTNFKYKENFWKLFNRLISFCFFFFVEEFYFLWSILVIYIS